MKNLVLNFIFKRNEFSLVVNMDDEINGILILSGASGEGKTSLLRCIAGLEPNCKGIIKFQNKTWLNTNNNIFMPTHLRKIGYIFQNSFLFPNLNVLENILFGEKRKHSNKFNTHEIIKKIKIEHLLKKNVFELSGGEKQKVALVRTLVNEPNLILMDEPLNSIDEESKKDIISFLNLFKELYNIPIIFVTHCHYEKKMLGDSEIILKNGVLNNNLKEKKSKALYENKEIESIKRYQKQYHLKEFGASGQKKLLNSKFLCVGAGGLGSPVCLYLAGAGAGTIGIVDDDTVELSNLHRQILYQTDCVGKEKISCAFESIKNINNLINVETYKLKLNSKNIESIITNYDIIIDCTDNFGSNFLLADVCVKYNKPLVYSCVNGFDGQLSVFHNKNSACFRCLFKQFPINYVPNCNTAGILGPACGIIGSMQALQAIYLALGKDHCEQNNLNILFNQFLKFDLKNFSISKFIFHKNKNCCLCSKKSEDIIISDYNDTCAFDENIPELYLHEIESELNYKLVDIREENEFTLSHFNNAINVPLSSLMHKNANFSLNKSTTLVVYCQGNSRSSIAIRLLKSEGFNNIIKLKGGFEGNS